MKRFVRVNLVLVPTLLLAGYLFIDSLPVLLLPLGVAYLTFAIVISLLWGLATLSLKIRS